MKEEVAACKAPGDHSKNDKLRVVERDLYTQYAEKFLEILRSWIGSKDPSDRDEPCQSADHLLVPFSSYPALPLFIIYFPFLGKRILAIRYLLGPNQ